MKTPKIGDWIKIPWMEGEPGAQILEIDCYGDPIVEHPLLPGLGPMTVDVWDFATDYNDPSLFVGEGI